ncbi:TPA: hypothetical protein ACF39K_002241 [Vibrio parahaemolyticus]|uniref:hypothetical protein n=1 Tax=Vibrio parahaemolyticus TaxID=670 RepID=UPI001A908D9B|nr:hypothetical protein [Vibrio parahaemolyticus]MBE4474937.1 hypothetical protein [Vibrio parahaemolyticus]MBO0155599.1 hypothetical protein [Vibrio parahaemolyticus]MBO0170818.1 hypothetical protein [Vibrio parahaemolyticus]MCX8858586.1 hypothetical protein [Vibrio parahaemolyticus]MCX8864262.1 hypothetical protein [Vibrio parahaemolyticus]
MQYVAIRLFGDGAMKRHKHTQESETTALGDFDSLDDAVNQACELLNCNHIRHGVLSEVEGLGGFIVVDAQEFTEI